MRNVAGYIQEARTGISPNRVLVLSEFQTLIEDYYKAGKLHGSGDLFELIGASFYFGFTVGVRQQKEAARHKRH